jgi:hypothetical protein
VSKDYLGVSLHAIIFLILEYSFSQESLLNFVTFFLEQESGISNRW